MERLPWMIDEEYESHLAVTLIAERMFACMIGGDRNGWILLSRIQKHIVH